MHILIRFNFQKNLATSKAIKSPVFGVGIAKGKMDDDKEDKKSTIIERDEEESKADFSEDKDAEDKSGEDKTEEEEEASF